MTPSEAPPPEACESCGGPNIVWHAPNEAWNAAMDPSGARGAILCPVCFGERYEQVTQRLPRWCLVPYEGDPLCPHERADPSVEALLPGRDRVLLSEARAPGAPRPAPPVNSNSAKTTFTRSYGPAPEDTRE